MAQYDDEEYDIEGDESMLLDEEMDDNYEPTDEGIHIPVISLFIL